MAQQTRVVAVKAESPARPSHPRSTAALLMKREMPVLGLSDFLKDKVHVYVKRSVEPLWAPPKAGGVANTILPRFLRDHLDIDEWDHLVQMLDQAMAFQYKRTWPRLQSAMMTLSCLTCVGGLLVASACTMVSDGLCCCSPEWDGGSVLELLQVVRQLNQRAAFSGSLSLIHMRELGTGPPEHRCRLYDHTSDLHLEPHEQPRPVAFCNAASELPPGFHLVIDLKRLPISALRSTSTSTVAPTSTPTSALISAPIAAHPVGPSATMPTTSSSSPPLSRSGARAHAPSAAAPVSTSRTLLTAILQSAPSSPNRPNSAPRRTPDTAQAGKADETPTREQRV